jgi:hypothetical protein
MRPVSAALSIIVAAGLSTKALADEGGVSFWVPGFFGSMAAAPQQPGFTLATIYYHTSVNAGGEVAFARQVRRGNIAANFRGNLNVNLDADVDLALAAPTYVFAERFLGAQAAIALLVSYGRNRAGVDATLTGALGPFGFATSAGRTDTVTGFGDPVPQFSLRWNMGVHNVMTYVTGNIPIGAYDPNRLANLGIGHGAIDGGAGYTYFNPQTGYEFSSVLGFTYNFKNDDTQYQNGVDMHLDMAASRFVTPQLQLGLVGYLYQQVGCDSGSGDRVGCFRSRVAGIGPQIGYVIPMGSLQGYLNLKGYKEFAAENRPDGWNVWLTFVLSPAAAPPPPVKRLVTKYGRSKLNLPIRDSCRA